MTATTTTTRAPGAARRRPVPWTKLAWVTWRQHRPALTGAAVFLGLVSSYLLIMGVAINNAYATGRQLPSGRLRDLPAAAEPSATNTGAAAAPGPCPPAARRPSPA